MNKKIDIEKVIRGLECCFVFDKTFECGENCQYTNTCVDFEFNE